MLFSMHFHCGSSVQDWFLSYFSLLCHCFSLEYLDTGISAVSFVGFFFGFFFSPSMSRGEVLDERIWKLNGDEIQVSGKDLEMKYRYLFWTYV